MVRDIMKDLMFLGQRAEPAAKEDIAIAEEPAGHASLP